MSITTTVTAPTPRNAGILPASPSGETKHSALSTKHFLKNLDLPPDFSTPIQIPSETLPSLPTKHLELSTKDFADDSLKLKKQLTTFHLQFASLNHASLALAKLVQLTDSKKPEVARRACMSLLKLAHQHNTKSIFPDDDPLFFPDDNEDDEQKGSKGPRVQGSKAKTSKSTIPDADALPSPPLNPCTPVPLNPPPSSPPFIVHNSSFSISPPPLPQSPGIAIPAALSRAATILTHCFVFCVLSFAFSHNNTGAIAMHPTARIQSSTMQTYATVATDQPLDATYTYSIPSHLQRDLLIGSRVTIPLGRSNRPTEATVLSISTTPPQLPTESPTPIPTDPDLFQSPPSSPTPQASRLKSILDLHRDVLPIPPDLLTLAQWISSYYCSPIGTTLSTMVPAAVKRATRLPANTFISLTDPTTPIPDQLAKIKISPKTRKVFEHLHPFLQPGPKPELETLTHAAIARPMLKRLLTLNLLRAQREIKLPEPALIGADLSSFIVHNSSLTLSPDQQSAMSNLTPLMDQNKFAVRLIHGVTGSGKTELYIRAIEKIVAQNKSAIVLVPEISLTPQTVRRFTARFPRVAILHSGMKDSERHQHYHAIATGWAQVIVGARSAIFAPSPNLGLIVVDEEHDSSYKQDNLPKYHGRDVAIRRAQMLNIPVLLGSATPSLESWHNAHTHKDWQLLSLTSRPLGTQMPRVLIVDMKGQAKERRGLHILSTTLEHHLKQTLEQKKQAIFLLNRRGYAHYVLCPRCDWVLMCDNCDATMVVHRKRPDENPLPTKHSALSTKHSLQGTVQCHYCLTAMMLPERCPLCQARLTHLGQGTQRAEDELLRKFPALRIKRMDSDSMNNAGDYQRALDAFGRGDLDLLIGTQMIAKGLDFPNVQLVGVLNSDLAMTIPDFRAAERTFQLICQVAGRSGRAMGTTDRGTVIVQTFQPSEPAILHACNHDYLGFVRSELPHRQEFGYPPYGRLVRIVLAHKSYSKVHAAADSLGRFILALTQKLNLPIRIQGPFPPPMERLIELYRVEFILSASSPRSLQQLVASLRGRGLLTSATATRPVASDIANVAISVDVDPIHMM